MHLPRARRPRLVHLGALVAVALATSAVPAAARAADAVAFSPCAQHKSFECATVTVPLDRSGRVPGTVPLHVERQRGTGGRSTLFLGLAGGPGQSSTDLAQTAWLDLGKPLATTHQIVAFDQRGTGDSGVIDCTKAYRGTRSEDVATARCGELLGIRRPFYTTTDSVEDIEAVRQAVGADRVVLVGVSYGTYLAQRYARAHPDRAAALVLDSVVPLSGVNQWNDTTFAAIPHVVDELCADGACPTTTTPAADLGTVAKRMESGPRGTYVSPGGSRSRERLTSAKLLFDVLVSSDFSPYVRAFTPGAIAAAKRGDWTPLVRLVGLSSRTGGSGVHGLAEERKESRGLYLATTCTDTQLPWAPNAPTRGRVPAFVAASNALSGPVLAQFPLATVRSAAIGKFCSVWPSTPVAAPAPDPGTPLAVPTLILSGGADLRTPVLDALDTQALIPGSALVVVPGVGHFTLGNDPTGCALTAYRSFLAGTAVGDPCTGRKDVPTTRPRPPLRLSEVAPFGARGTAGRVTQAALSTVSDAYAVAATLGGRTVRSGGLRSGRFVARATGGPVRLTLTRTQYLPGLSVSGTVSFSASGPRGTITVRGATSAQRGTLRISGDTVSGTIGGTRVRTSAVRAAGGGAGPLGGLTSAAWGPGVDIG